MWDLNQQGRVWRKYKYTWYKYLSSVGGALVIGEMYQCQILASICDASCAIDDTRIDSFLDHMRWCRGCRSCQGWMGYLFIWICGTSGSNGEVSFSLPSIISPHKELNGWWIIHGGDRREAQSSIIHFKYWPTNLEQWSWVHPLRSRERERDTALTTEA